MATGEGIRIHPRYFKVTEARLTFMQAVIKAEVKNDLAIETVIGILLAIAVETNKVEALKARKAPDLDGIGEGFYRELVAVEKTHELTPSETLKILFEIVADFNKYAIRLERHPEDPDKKGDEA